MFLNFYIMTCQNQFNVSWSYNYDISNQLRAVLTCMCKKWWRQSTGIVQNWLIKWKLLSIKWKLLFQFRQRMEGLNGYLCRQIHKIIWWLYDSNSIFLNSEYSCDHNNWFSIVLSNKMYYLIQLINSKCF